MGWLFLAGAILTEVGATVALRLSIGGSKAWYLAVGAGYLASFALLSLTLANGVGLGVAYGVWAATGVALTAVISRFLFKEPLTVIMGAGIALIAGGVLLIELGSA